MLAVPGDELVGSDYNISMQNKSFAAKKPVLAASRVYLNKHFARPELVTWNEDTIRQRGLELAQAASKVWVGPS